MKGYITERKGRSSWERQGIVAFCTLQWNEWMIEWIYIYIYICVCVCVCVCTVFAMNFISLHYWYLTCCQNKAYNTHCVFDGNLVASWRVQQIGSIDCPKTLEANCSPSQRYISEERKPWRDAIMLDWGSSDTLDFVAYSTPLRWQTWAVEVPATVLWEPQNLQVYRCKMWRSYSNAAGCSYLLPCDTVSPGERLSACLRISELL